VNETLAKQYEKQLHNFEGMQPVQSCCIYESPLFEGLNAHGFDQDDADWANNYIRIFSGIYGMVRPFDVIQPFSLPVTLGTKLTTSKGKYLRDYWREMLAKELEDALDDLPMPVIINCASEQDAELLTAEMLPENTQVHTVDFKITDKDEAASAKGEFVRWALENRCMMVEELLEFKGLIDEGEEAMYRLSPKQSGPNTIQFEENIGGGTTYKRQLAQSGVGKTKFMHEVASGKNRWRRTEIKQEFAREAKITRTARKKNAFY